MKKHIYLILVIILMFLSIGFIIGCGGSSEVTNFPASATPANTTGSDRTGTLYIEIKWPQSDMEGTCIFSSGNAENTITASMPCGTEKINVEVYKAGTTTDPVGSAVIPKDIFTAEIKELPLLLVDIKITPLTVGLSPLPNSVPIVIYGYQIVFGLNVIHANLGEEHLTLLAPFYITLNSPLSSSATVGTPVPELEGKAEIIARLTLDSPDIPDQPTPNALPGSGIEENTVESQGAWGFKDCEIKFTVVSGAGLLTPVGSNDHLSEVTFITDDHDYANVFLWTNTPGDTTVKAECQLDPNDPNSVISATCTVAAVGPEEAWIYDLKMGSGEGTVRIIPDFHAAPEYGVTYDAGAYFDALLEAINIGTGEIDPIEGATISFNIIEGSGYGDSITPEGTTDASGQCQVWLDVNDGNLTERTLTVEAKFIDPDDPDNIKAATSSILVTSENSMGDNFESYPYGTRAYQLHLYGSSYYTTWWASFDAGEEDPVNREYNYIDSGGAKGTNQSLRLYASYTAMAQVKKAAFSWSSTFHEITTYSISCECRCSIKMDDTDSQYATVGVTNDVNETWLMTFRDTFTDADDNVYNNVIFDCNNEMIPGLSYNPGEWYEVHIQIIGVGESMYTPPESFVIKYWLNGSCVHTVNWSYWPVRGNRELVLLSFSGTVWFDEVDFFHL